MAGFDIYTLGVDIAAGTHVVVDYEEEPGAVALRVDVPGALVIYLPDELVKRLIVGWLCDHPRLEAPFYRQISSIARQRLPKPGSQRRRLDPGPLPVKD